MNIYDDGIGEVTLIQSMGDDNTPALAARVSFAKMTTQSEMSQRDESLINYLAVNRHTSPFEHISATFLITCPLFIARQIQRHRTFSYNEISRRYTSKDIEFYIPRSLRKQAQTNLQCSLPINIARSEEFIKVIREHTKVSLEKYHTLLDQGVSREQARAILPQSMYTSFWMSGNLLNWSKFLRLRLDEHAQPEATEVAQAIQSELLERYPTSLGALLLS
jgi:thymidylate synthase (FAD)